MWAIVLTVHVPHLEGFWIVLFAKHELA